MFCSSANSSLHSFNRSTLLLLIGVEQLKLFHFFRVLFNSWSISGLLNSTDFSAFRGTEAVLSLAGILDLFHEWILVIRKQNHSRPPKNAHSLKWHWNRRMTKLFFNICCAWPKYEQIKIAIFPAALTPPHNMRHFLITKGPTFALAFA